MQQIIDPDKLSVRHSTLSTEEAARISAAGLDPADFCVLEVPVLAQGAGWQDVPGQSVLMLQVYAALPGRFLSVRPSRMYDANGQLAADRKLTTAIPMPGTMRVLVRSDVVLLDVVPEET